MLKLLLALIVMLSAACAPEIGDSCENSFDCSVNGDRVCDIAQFEGYCTVTNCEADTCPTEATCIEFRPEPQRLASSWCMFRCEDDGDCRSGYACRAAADLMEGDVPLARNLDFDADTARFCVVD